MYVYGYDWTYIFVLIGAVVVMFAQTRMRATYNKYARVASKSGLTGAQVAAKILKSNNIYDVSVQPVQGELTDNYNPMKIMTMHLPAHSLLL